MSEYEKLCGRFTIFLQKRHSSPRPCVLSYTSVTDIATFPITMAFPLKIVTFPSRMDEEQGVASGGSFIIKDPPQMGAQGEVKPRTKPKPKIKSQTVSGIALPGLAEVLSKKQLAAENKVR